MIYRLVFACFCLAFIPATTEAQIFDGPATPSTAGTAAALKNPAVTAPQVSLQAAPTIGGAFALTNQNGTRVTDANFRSSYMLVTFGYTRCGGECSPAVSTMLQALDKLSQAQANRVLPVFVTLDPARDDPAALKNFLTMYNNRVIGLTGSPGEIDRMARSYSVYYKTVENAETAIERSLSPQDLAELRRDPEYRREGGEPYLLDHSRFIYLMGPDGQFVRLFNGDLPVDVVVKGLMEAVK